MLLITYLPLTLAGVKSRRSGNGIRPFLRNPSAWSFKP